MPFRILIAALLLLVATVTSPGQEREYYFRFVVRPPQAVDIVTRQVSIASVRGDTVYAFANEHEWEAFLKLGYCPELLSAHSGSGEAEMSDRPLWTTDWDVYPTYAGYVAMMQQYERDYPGLCRLDTIGWSTRGKLLLALKISDSVDVQEDEPEFLYAAAMHGNETVGYVLMLRLADELLRNYGRDSADGGRLTRLVDSLEIWIHPLANPDGTYYQTDTSVSSARRGNANGVNLNRDFPDRIDDPVNTPDGREAETRAMMSFVRHHNFTLSANFHGGAQVVNYPWDNGAASGTYAKCPDDAWFIHLSRVYATPNPDIMSGGFPNGITNGCAWYVIYGGRQDWIYWWHGGRETTIELTNEYVPPGSVLPQKWLNNRESFLAYMEEALKGVRGIVRDASTGKPLAAEVRVATVPGVPVYSDSVVGDYHRMLLPGAYTLIVSAPGFVSDTLEGVVVTDGAATRLDVALQPIRDGVARAQDLQPAGLVLDQNFPNPFNPATVIRYHIPPDAHGDRARRHTTLEVFDPLGRRVATLVDMQHAPGTYTVTFDGSTLASGVYFYRLSSGPTSLTRTMVLLE